MRFMTLFVLSLVMVILLSGCAPKRQPSALEARATQFGAVRVIARLAVEPAAAQQIVSTASASALADMQVMGVGNATALSETLPLVVADVTAEQLRQIETSPKFEGVIEDRLTFASLAESTKLIGAPQVWSAGGRGAGQAVAILDTGVDATHPFLAGRVTAEACFSTTSSATGAQSNCPDGSREQIGPGAGRPCLNADGCEHGTHVAGIAAGRGAQFSGVAPDAEIVAVQVFSKFIDTPRGAAPCRDGGQRSPCIASFTSDQIRALEFVRQQAATRHIASVNMSLGGGRSAEACDGEFIKPAIDALRAAGVATAIAAGNDGFADAVSFPGCVSTAVTVGSTTKADQVSTFSNRGPMVDLYAPGTNINSSIPGGRFAVFSGTSMAAPHVAGAFAALRSARPAATVDDIERALKSAGVTVDRRPRIALPGALSALSTTPAQESPPVVAAAAGASDVMAEIAALPPDREVRVIAKARVALGAPAATVAEATKRVSDAARTAGASLVEPMSGQPLVVIEAKPAALQALMRSGAVEALQLDRPARPQ